MKVADLFPSKFLKAEDMKGRAATLTIKEVKLEESFGSTKPVLYFQKTEKAFTVNSTNARIITQLLAEDETDNWVGAEVTLTPVMRKIAGELKRVIDVTDARFPEKQQPSPPPVPVQPEPDEIPF
jgi:hypothetical protein